MNKTIAFPVAIGILVAVCLVTVFTVAITKSIQYVDYAEDLAFESALNMTNYPQYIEAIHSFYFNGETRQPIENTARRFMEEIMKKPYEVGDEAYMMLMVTGGKYTAKRGNFGSSIRKVDTHQ